MMFTGTTQQQDTRFSDKEKKLMKQMKFGDCLNKRVDMSKVKLDVLRPWISKKITDILHIEDDVVAEFVYNQLEEEKFPCPKKMQINMTGFLNGPNARQFMGELWSLLLSAQESESGIPAEFIQQKKDEILKREEDMKIKERNERERSRSPSRSRERDRRVGGTSSNTSGGSATSAAKERETLSQKEREQQLPPSTLSAIEQVRSQLSAKSRSSSDEGNKKDVDDNVNKNSASTVTNNDSIKKERSRSSSRAAIGEKDSKVIRSPHRRSRERSIQKASSRDRNSPPRRRHSSRDKDRRKVSRSPRRRSVDRRRRRSRSRERSGRRQKSRSPTPQKRRDSSRSRHRRSRSRSVEKRKSSPLLKPLSPRRRRSLSRSPNPAQNGHEGDRNVSARNPRNPFASKAPGDRRSFSRSRSLVSPIKKPIERPRSREKSSVQRFSRSRSRSSVPPSPKRNPKRSPSRQTSLSLSPEPNQDDFELRRNKNSVQKKRQYRHNRDSSVSSVEREIGGVGGGGGGRRPDSRGRSGGMSQNRRRSTQRNEGRGGRQDRSRSRRRSRSRQRSRSRNRSRSPRRPNRRRSPVQHQFWGHRGNNNNNNNSRGRFNQWRRSYSRERGNNSGSAVGNRIERRSSPQRRYSRERRSSPMQNQFRKFPSPQRRALSPQYRDQRRTSRERVHNSRDRRPSSPWRAASRERGSSNLTTATNRWDQPTRNMQKPKQRSISVSSNWEDNEREEEIQQKNNVSRRISVDRKRSPVKNSGSRRERSRSRSSQERYKRESNTVDKGHRSRESIGRSSVEYCGPSVKTIDLSKDEQITEVARKSKLTTLPPPGEEKSKKLTSAGSATRRNRYSNSLSRTPSPFLKPHERKQAALGVQTTVVAVAQKKTQDKPSETKKRRNDSDSSSSDTSDDSEDDSDEDSSDENEEEPKKRMEKEREKFKIRTDEIKKVSHKTNTNQKLEKHSRSLTRKSNKSSSSDSESDGSEDSEDDKSRKKLMIKSSKPMPSKTANHKESRTIVPPAIEDERKREKLSVETIDKRKHIAETKDSNVSVKRIKTNSDLANVSVGASKKSHNSCSTRTELKKQATDSDSEDKDERRENLKLSSKLANRKRTQSAASISGHKKGRHNVSSDSDEHVSKKKRKKAKKSSSKHNSDDETSSDSENESNKQKKKHKKHKKHSSKKSKKHKKHKKKSKKSVETSSSSDDERITRGESHKRDDKAVGKVSTTASMLLGGVNEDLEKQLRERALKSMKKLD
uniref:Serine/arginine repetitive matrix protein 1 n=1 Tax=Glossina pallidipes TaxID=7398 RepID=A0A1A9ZS89_GLOPL